MPRKKDRDILGITDTDSEPEGKRTGRPAGKVLTIPVTDQGTLDESRAKPERIAKVRAILSVEGGPAPAPLPGMQVPREFIPFLYDGFSYVIRSAVKLAKWPRVMTPEQREEFCGFLAYSEDFKKEATEPTGAVLDKLVGSSAITKWLMEHSEVAMLVALIGKGTVQMFHSAGQQFALAHAEEIAKEAAKQKTNGGVHPPSENRPVPVPIA